MSEFGVRIPQRWVDLDAQGHVNNATLVDYLQEARIAFLLNSPHGDLLGHGIIVVNHQVEYLGAISFGRAPVGVTLVVGTVSAAAFAIGYEVHEGDRLVARARTTLARFDLEAGRPTRWRPDERAWFTARSTDVTPLPPLGRWRVGDAAHTHPISVRWSDVDAFGHVNNTTFYDYVAEARIALHHALGATGPRASMDSDPDRTWMVARQDMTYVGQMLHRLVPYAVRTAVAKVGHTSVTLVAEIVDPDADAVLARSTTVLVHGDRSGRPVPLPVQMHEAARLWPAVGEPVTQEPVTKTGAR